MKYILLISGFLFSLINPVFSQELTQTIKGKVIDAESLQPLPGANSIGFLCLNAI